MSDKRKSYADHLARKYSPEARCALQYQLDQYEKRELFKAAACALDLGDYDEADRYLEEAEMIDRYEIDRIEKETA